MECLVANVDHVVFDVETALDEQYGALPLPFPGMDKSIAAVCQFFCSPSGCQKGPLCPFRHVRGDRTIVCKHWLRGLCKKGDQCEFLHEYDMTKMPECYFYSRFNACHNKECPFLHIDPESKIKDCPWYDRGFCRHGPHCRHRHVRRVLCTNYVAGFCPDGPDCKYMHPRFELPAPPDQNLKDLKKPPVIICHFCGEHGHKAIHCHKINPENKEAVQNEDGNKEQHNNNASENSEQQQPHQPQQQQPQQQQQQQQHQPQSLFSNRMVPKKLEDVTCYKCGTKGHYANRCPKGHLAFLSQAKALQDNQSIS